MHNLTSDCCHELASQLIRGRLTALCLIPVFPYITSDQSTSVIAFIGRVLTLSFNLNNYSVCLLQGMTLHITGMWHHSFNRQTHAKYNSQNPLPSDLCTMHSVVIITTEYISAHARKRYTLCSWGRFDRCTAVRHNRRYYEQVHELG